MYSLDEKQILEGINTKNKLIFEYLFESYYSGLCAFCLRYIDNKEIIEDLVQELFMSLWSKKENLEVKTSLKSYLFTSIKNKCLDHNKHSKVKNKYREYISKHKSIAEDTINECYIESELRSLLESELNKLPPRCKEIFVLSRFEGKSNAEIASLLNISKRTVELQISNALKLLKVSLKDYYFLLFVFLS